MCTVRNGERRKVAARTGACGVVLLGLLSNVPARAAWEFVPDVGIGAESEENPRLDPDSLTTDVSTSTSAVLTAGATLATFDERSALTFTPTLISYRYADAADSDLESNDWYFDGQGERQWQTVTAGFNASFARERLLSAELIGVDRDGNPDTDDPVTGDTGRLEFINEDRESLWINPYVSFNVSDRNSIRLEVTEYDYVYSGGDRGFRTGFDNTRYAVSINRNVDERNVVSATMAAESFEADGTQNQTDTVVIEGGFTRPITELWTVNLAAGVLRSEFQFLTSAQQTITNRATTDYTMRIGLRKRTERARMNIDFTRNVYPSGNGFSSLRRELRVFYGRALTERLNASFGVRLNDTESLGGINIEDNREYNRAEIDFEWALRRVVFLTAGYSFTSQDFTEDVIGGTQSSNGIYVGMAYRGLSRQQR